MMKFKQTNTINTACWFSAALTDTKLNIFVEYRYNSYNPSYAFFINWACSIYRDENFYLKLMTWNYLFRFDPVNIVCDRRAVFYSRFKIFMVVFIFENIKFFVVKIQTWILNFENVTYLKKDIQDVPRNLTMRVQYHCHVIQTEITWRVYTALYHRLKFWEVGSPEFLK